MKNLSNINPLDLAGKTVIVRVDFNVAIVDGKIVDDLRIRASFDTVTFLRDADVKVILISHIENKEKPSLETVANHINSSFRDGKYPYEVSFMPELPNSFVVDEEYIDDQKVKELKALVDAELKLERVVLFENLRVIAGEKENDTRFAEILASFADYYINDAFSASHRSHASIIGIPELLPHAAGFRLEQEISHLEKGLKPTHPFIFILGGAKFDTKLPLIEKFLKVADKVVVGGALFNDILKAKGLNVGTSLVSRVDVDLSAIISDPKLITPQNVIVRDSSGDTSTVAIDKVQDDESILDIGADLITQMRAYFESVALEGQKPFVLWNGPMGNYEIGFKDQTVALAQLLSNNGIESLLGGGDTTAAMSKLLNVNPCVYVSTGGGAMIEFLLNETLPGIDALN